MEPLIGYFDDASVIRRVHREHVVGLSAPRALLMQAAHPLAFAGLFASTNALNDPYGRLRRTARVLDLIMFGERSRADAATERVRAAHRRISGRLDESIGFFPRGTRWSADDPALKLWVIATLANSALVVYERFIGALESTERDAYWSDYRVIGRLFGLADTEMPATAPELERYVADMVNGDLLHVTSSAYQLAMDVVVEPRVPIWLRAPVGVLGLMTVGLLPSPLRVHYGLKWSPTRAKTFEAGTRFVKKVVPVLPASVRYYTGPRRAENRRPVATIKC